MAIYNTLKTTVGCFATMITRYTPFDLSRDSLEGIFNYLPISESLLTSGQPTEAQSGASRRRGICM